jgi:hypothetical protein
MPCRNDRIDYKGTRKKGELWQQEHSRKRFIDQKAAENMVKAMKAAKKRPKEEYIDVRASIERSVSLLPKTLRR